MSRLRKKMNYDADRSMRELTAKVVASYGEAYDDRYTTDRDHASLRDVAAEYNITILKARKILITVGMFSTETSRNIQQLADEGRSIPEIVEITGLSRASVHSYIPYTKLIYNMDETSVDADRKKHQRQRQRSCKAFMDILPYLKESDADEALWEVLEELQGCVFHTSRKLRFKYTIKGGELFVDRKKDSITKATVFMAFHKSQELGGVVTGPKKLGTFGASYLYPIFERSGIIKTERADNLGACVNKTVITQKVIENGVVLPESLILSQRV